MSSAEAVSDDALLEAWSAGGAQAGVTLVQRHYDAVFAFFANKTNADEAAELTQDTFCALTQARDRFKRQSSVRTYVFAIARWKLTEHFRRKTSHRQRFVSTDEASSRETSAGSHHSALDSLLEGRRRESLLVMALRSLPLDDQLLLELKSYEQLSLRELAEIFELSTGTMASRVRRARGRLERSIREFANNPGLAEETLTGLDTYMQQLRKLSIHPC